MIFKFRRRESPYAMIDKRGLTDSRLTWRAKGILAYCMTLPAHLRVSMVSLVDSAPDGAKSLRSGMRELAEFGYAYLETIRDKHGHIIGTQWVIYESPELHKEDAETTKGVI